MFTKTTHSVVHKNVKRQNFMSRVNLKLSEYTINAMH